VNDGIGRLGSASDRGAAGRNGLSPRSTLSLSEQGRMGQASGRCVLGGFLLSGDQGAADAVL
jgi:hypothetical protein